MTTTNIESGKTEIAATRTELAQTLAKEPGETNKGNSRSGTTKALTRGTAAPNPAPVEGAMLKDSKRPGTTRKTSPRLIVIGRTGKLVMKLTASTTIMKVPAGRTKALAKLTPTAAGVAK